jgi:hypothetical protein
MNPFTLADQGEQAHPGAAWQVLLSEMHVSPQGRLLDGSQCLQQAPPPLGIRVGTIGASVGGSEVGGPNVDGTAVG